jgi:hypothetical protein
MKLIYLPLLMVAGCTPQIQPQFSGPASLRIVPPSYYSIKPPLKTPVRKRQIQTEPEQPRYYYPEPGKPVPFNPSPVSIDPEAQQVEEKLDEAADKLHKLRQRLNRRRPAFGAQPEPPPEDTQ